MFDNKTKNTVAAVLLILFLVSLTASAASAGKVVSLSALQKAAANDPSGPQGATTPEAVDSVKIVEAALVEAGFLTDNSYAYDGSYGTATIKAYQKWQRSLGSAERYCDGIPGKIDLTKLGEKYGFTVDTSIPESTNADLNRFNNNKPEPTKFDFNKFNSNKLEPTKFDFNKFNSNKLEPTKFDFNKFNSNKLEPTKFDFNKFNSNKLEPTKFDFNKFNSNKLEPTKFDFNKFNSNKLEPTKFDFNKFNSNKPEPTTKPVAKFSVTPTSGYAPLEVTFEDESTGNPLWKWWGFGDGTGSNSTANKVTHTYTKPGEYTVFLKVTNKAGTSTKTYPVPITVIDGVTDINLDVPLIKQGDSQWSKDKLGSSSTTIGAKGCAITSTSMVFNYYGVQTNPKDLNIWLKQNNGYAGKNKNEIDWGTAARMSEGKVKFIGRFGTNLTKIKSELNNGHPVIAQVPSKSSSKMHFVVITGYSGSTYYINDPDSNASELSYYNKDPAKAIKSIRIYH